MGFSRAGHAAVRLADGRVAVFGGETGSGVGDAAVVHAYSPATGSFGAIGSLLSGRTALTATALPDGRVLVVGSSILTGAPRAEVFAPATGTSAGVTLTVARSDHAATLLADGRVLLSGGSSTLAIGSAEIFEPLTASSAPVPSALAIPRVGHRTALLADGRVLLYGGQSASGAPSTPEIFDPAALTFTPLPAAFGDLIANRVLHSLSRFSRGPLVMLGGEDATQGVPTDTTLVLAEDGSTLAALPRMPRPRSAHTTSALSDGRLLVAGGFATSSSTDLYAPSDLLQPDGTWALGPNMAIPRVLHTATELTTGEVLVIGGNDATRGVIGTAEIFD